MSYDQRTQDVANTLADYNAAKGKKWIRQAEASRRLSKALSDLLGVHIGPGLEARVTLYPVTAKDAADEKKARDQDAAAKSQA